MAAMVLMALGTNEAAAHPPRGGRAGRHRVTRRVRRGRHAPRPVTTLASDFARQQDAVRLVSGALVRRCWTQQLMRAPATTARTLALAIHVDRDGVISVAAPGDRSPLGGCVAFGARGLRRVGAGRPLDVGTTVALARGER